MQEDILQIMRLYPPPQDKVRCQWKRIRGFSHTPHSTQEQCETEDGGQTQGGGKEK